MILTREEREKQIVELYEQGHTYKQIAGLARVSVRDIKPILEMAEKEKERQRKGESDRITQAEKENDGNRLKLQKPSIVSQAYRLFSEGKTPMQVAVELNLREAKTTKYYREFWKLNRLYNLNLIYEDIKDNIVPFEKLYRRIKRAGIKIEHAVNIIELANYDLPIIEQRYQRLIREVNELEIRRSEEFAALRKIEYQKANVERTLKSLCVSSQKEAAKKDQLQWESMKLERLVELFRNKKEYQKIRNIVQEKVDDSLLDSRGLLRLALYSLIESMGKDPDKYSALINYTNDSNRSTSVRYNSEYHKDHFTGRNRFTSYDSFFGALKSTLLDDADKLYQQLLKEETNTIISNYASYRSSSLIPKRLVNNQGSMARFDK
jgi:transposase